MATSLAKKLNLKPGMKLNIPSIPELVELDDVSLGSPSETENVLVFITKLAEIDHKCESVIQAARQDNLAWIAYPKAKKLGTDLNRDILWQHMEQYDIQGVRMISIDDTWSAMRFRVKK